MPEGRAIRAFRVVATIAAAALVLRLLHSADLGRALGQMRASGPRLLLVLVPFAVGMALDALCWSWILAALGGLVRYRPLLRLRMGAEALVLSVPGGSVAAEVIKPVLLAREQRVPMPLGAASVAVKKSLYFLADALYLGTGVAGGWTLLVALGAEAAGSFGSRLLPAVALSAVFGLAALGLLFASGLNRGLIAGRLFALLERVPVARFRRWISARAAGFVAVDASARLFFERGPRLVVPCFLLLFGQWLTEATETFLIVRLLGLEVRFLPVLAFESLNSLVRSLAFFVPAGLGIQDMGQVLFVKTMGSADAATVGAAVLLTKRSKDLVWSLVGYWFLARTRRAAA